MKLVEAQRLEQRTRFDLEMMHEIGFCKGIENYSRHLSGRQPGEPPPTLVDYLPQDALVFIDESHVTIPQIGGMYSGDRARKENLVDYGFRLPSALDNRPLRFEEFEQLLPQTIFVSATPADYERKHAGQVVEQVVRPTGLVDPALEVRPAQTQVDDLLSEINVRVERGERVLVTTLTKRMAEDLTDYLNEHGVKVRYLHSDIETVERVEIIRDLRLGEFDVLVGINLLREGLDIPGGVAGGDSRRRQGRVPARRALADPDHRPRGAAHQRHGHPVRRQDDRFDARRDRRNRSAAREAGRVQRTQGITPKGVQKRIKDIIDGVYDIDEEKKAAQGRTGARQVRGDAGEGSGARTQAHREGDARCRAQSGVREGGGAARPPVSAQGEALRRCGAGLRSTHDRAPPIQESADQFAVPKHEHTVLVLQGGGALGAYQAGVYEGMAERGFAPNWVTGVSIGAINAALIAGNRPGAAARAPARILGARLLGRCRSFAPAFLDPLRLAFDRLSAMATTTFGVPGFFVPRVPPPYFVPDGSPGALSFYDTAPLRETLESSWSTSSLSTAKRSGFRSVRPTCTPATRSISTTRQQAIGPEHIMASGALPPGFPPVVIDGNHYWDGGIVSNSPLWYVLDDAPGFNAH